MAIVLTTRAQKEANNWYFGVHAGINFGLGSPIPLTDGALDTGEGCSSISSSTGALILYTDGQFVYTRTHQLMPNGSGLMGNYSATQSGIIVPLPGSTTEFYIFTVDGREDNLVDGFRYSVVDMTLNGGLGDVIPGQKNILLVAPADEKVTAVGNSIGTATWVIAHKWESNQYYAFLVAASGISANPVISSVGQYMGGDMEWAKGYMKSSPDGTKLAVAHNTMHSIEIFDFNNATGVISNPILDNGYIGDPGGPYGLEFSPNSKLLYVSQWKEGRKIFQYDLEAGSPDDILASKNLVASVGQGDAPFGALQIGPDNRMYIARDQVTYLSRIAYPNVYGTGCTFQADAVQLAGRQSRYGLPPFIQSFFQFSVEYYYDPACFGTPTQFYTSSSDDPDSVRWNFGDPLSGAENVSTLLNPQHLFIDTTKWLFAVSLKAYIGNHSVNAMHLIFVSDPPAVTLGNDTTVCTGDSYVIDAGAGFAGYLWQNGDTSQTITADTSGLYWCEVRNAAFCTDRDSVFLTILPKYTFTADTSICKGETIFIGGGNQGEPGTYYDSLLTVMGCDSVMVTNLTVKDTFRIVYDMAICEGDSIFAGGGWQNETGSYFDYYQTMLGCDSTIVTNLTVGSNMIIPEAVKICPGDSAFLEGAWQQQPGIYYDTISSGTGCDSVFITTLALADTFYITTAASICQGDSIFLEGSWQKLAGTYLDHFFTVIGCDSTIATQLTVISPKFGTDQATICEGDSIFTGGAWQTQAGTYLNNLLSAAGCDSIVTFTLLVTPVVYGTDQASICKGDSIFLGGAYQTSAGIYSDTHMSAAGCDSIVSTTLNVNERFTVDKDTSICEGESIFLGNAWQDKAGTYYDYLLTIKGCDSTIMTDLSIISMPTVYLGNDTILQDGSEILLDATYPGASYLWQDGTTDSTYLVKLEGSYSVTVTTSCGANTDSIYVTFGNFFCDPYAPNAFTPNQDGKNDSFRPILGCEILDYKLYIFNRWGEMIFTTTDRNEGWDGMIKNQPASADVYVWVLVYKMGLYNMITEKTAKGNVVLMR
jgi:gliding motility-associated-like protein